MGVRREPARVMAAIRATTSQAVVLDAPRGDADETARTLAYLDGVAAAAPA